MFSKEEITSFQLVPVKFKFSDMQPFGFRKDVRDCSYLRHTISPDFRFNFISSNCFLLLWIYIDFNTIQFDFTNEVNSICKLDACS